MVELKVLPEGISKTYSYRFNRSMVELKAHLFRSVRCDRTCFNRSMVELKVRQESKGRTGQPRFNRSMVELKVSVAGKRKAQKDEFQSVYGRIERPVGRRVGK